jgi:hypothetical protein
MRLEGRSRRIADRALEIPLVAQDQRPLREPGRIASRIVASIDGRLEGPVVAGAEGVTCAADGPAQQCAQPRNERGPADGGRFMKPVLMRAKCGHAGSSNIRRNGRGGSGARCRQNHRKSRWPAAPRHRRGIKAGPGYSSVGCLRSAPCSLRGRTSGCRPQVPSLSLLCGKPGAWACSGSTSRASP